ncbi:MAG: hypothetical protein AAFN74_26730 [Myxococcota bacterium]
MQPAIYSWVSSALGEDWTVIWGSSQGPGAASEGPRPAKPFAAIQVITGPNPSGEFAETPVDVATDQMDVRIAGPATMQLEIQLFEPVRSPANARALAFSVSDETHRDALTAAGLTPFEFVETRDISAIASGEREGRYSVEFTFNLCMQRMLIDEPFIGEADAVFSQA